MKAILCVQKLAPCECKSPGGAHDAYPELLRLGKTDFDGGICHAFSASENHRDSFGSGTTFEEHSEGDPVTEWSPETIWADGFYSP